MLDQVIVQEGKAEPQAATKPSEQTPNATPPAPLQKIKVDGLGEYTAEEIRKGFLMQADYTKKTQQIAEDRRRFEEEQKKFQEQEQRLRAELESARKAPEKSEEEPTDPGEIALKRTQKLEYEIKRSQEVQRLASEENELRQKYGPDVNLDEVYAVLERNPEEYRGSLIRAFQATKFDQVYRASRSAGPSESELNERVNKEVEARLAARLAEMRSSQAHAISEPADTATPPAPVSTGYRPGMTKADKRALEQKILQEKPLYVQ